MKDNGGQKGDKSHLFLFVDTLGGGDWGSHQTSNEKDLAVGTAPPSTSRIRSARDLSSASCKYVKVAFSQALKFNRVPSLNFLLDD